MSLELENWKRRGLLIVVSAPSGAGKTTLCHRLREEFPLEYSISCTTRPPRAGEEDGVDYFFLTKRQFEEKVAAGEFLEYAEVHGNSYGTRRENILEHLRNGRDVLLDIDTAGAQQIRQCQDELLRTSLTDIFVMPPGLDELAERLINRGTEDEEVLKRRLRNAREEMRRWQEFKFVIVSDSKDVDYDRFRAIYVAQRSQTPLTLPPEEFEAHLEAPIAGNLPSQITD